MEKKIGRHEKETCTGGCGLRCIHCRIEDVLRRIDEKTETGKIWMTHFEKIGDKYICNVTGEDKDVTNEVCNGNKDCFTPAEECRLLSSMLDTMEKLAESMGICDNYKKRENDGVDRL